MRTTHARAKFTLHSITQENKETMSESMICEEEDAKVDQNGGMITQKTQQIKQEPEQESPNSADVSFSSHKKSFLKSLLTRKGSLIPHACLPEAPFGCKEGNKEEDAKLCSEQMQVKQEWTIKEEVDSDMIHDKDERQACPVKEEGNSEFTDEEGDIEFIDDGVGEVLPGFKIERQAQKEPSSNTDTITSTPPVIDQPAPSKEMAKGNLRVLSADEERQLLQKLERQQKSGSLPPHLQHLLQILSVRCGKSNQTSFPLSQSQYKHGMCAITSPVTRNEKECLIKIVKEFQGLIDDYSTVAVFRKAAVWQDIAARFNAATGNRKSSQQVRKIWERIRSRTRKDYIRMKLQQRRTREGQPPTLLDPLSSQVLPLIRKELDPIDKAWDRDADLRVEALLQESDANESSLTFTSTTIEPLPCHDGTSTEPERTQQGSSTRSPEPAVHNMPPLKMLGSGASGFLLIPNVGSTPHQPKTAVFPKRVFGKANPVARSFQPSWFHRWPWIHYDEINDKAFCHVCVKAYTQNLISAMVVEPLFISRGFTNWKDVTTKRGFPAHERSDCHREAVERLFNLPSKKQDVKIHLPAEHEEERAVNRKNLLKVLSNIQFLSKQGFTNQGDCDDCNSTLIQLCRLRAEDDPQLMTWIMTKGDAYTSAEFQNEILEVMGRRVLKEIATCLQNTDFFSIMVNEITDPSNEVQLVVCIRWVDDNLEAHEEFIGLHKLEKIGASSVTAMIKDVLMQMNLSLQKVRGQCYDGCYSFGEKKTVATQMKQDKPCCLYCNCYDFSLSLTCVDSIKNIRVVKEAVETIHEITKMMKKFPNCDERLERIKEIMNEERQDRLGMHEVSPNRWTVGAKTINSIIENYASLKESWTWALSHCSDPELKEKISSIHVHMMNFSIFFGLVLAECLLQHVYSLSTTLKNHNLPAAEGQSVAAATVATLSNLQTESEFEQFWSSVLKKSKQNEIDSLTSCQHEEQGSSKYPVMSKDLYRDIYLEALGLMISSIQDHFDQQDNKMYINCEQLLLKAASGRDFTDEFQTVTNFYSSDFVPQELQMHLNTFTHLMSSEVNVLLSDVLMYLQSLSSSQQQEISQVVKLAKLILVMPVTKAASGHLCSTLRHIRTYLQITLTENHVNHHVALYVHKERTTGLSLIDVANEFVSRSENRAGVFGTFTSSDYAKNKVLVEEKSTQYSCHEIQ